ncbi:tetratricopeptide repeat protein [Aquabacterium sp. A7-Y]|uniref:tetratricopeptide repeat protein n=1 Tax=Aquabacterium sp. A7-Y TaxID=1349605 RepID=UPI00223E787D|nr:tetratricopeptide repeat protein [Aquabacterium sp. A7-Y]MCW7540754.1 tetratricopeptide repeat protein [Aquabacterium sp. A7-Y]
MSKPSSKARRGSAKAPAHLSLGDALRLAVEMHRTGALDDAETLYQRILKLAPRQADALHFLGVLQHQRGRSEEAWPLIERSLQANSKLPDWHNNAGNVLLEMGRLDEAAEAYERCLALAPERPDLLNNLGVLRRAQRRPDDAEAAYRRAIELAPDFADAYNNLGNLMSDRGRSQDALALYIKAIELKPRHPEARKMLGIGYCALGRVEEAARVYREWLAEEPGNPVAAHYLAACSGEAAPVRASDAYVEDTFDRFANSFDAKLARLSYRAPQLIQAAVEAACGAPQKHLDVLDAGCGTGLCGPGLAPYARRLVGVDLSGQMLSKAEPRGVYDQLTKAELTAFIEAAPDSYDLIVSADTLCYFGDLGAVSAAACRALRPGGWLVFTVEAWSADDVSTGFHLHPHGRYSHDAAYVRRVLLEAGFEPPELQSQPLRNEGGKPVQGWVVTARVPDTAALH